MNKREIFINYAKQIKALGYRVYIQQDTMYNYGYIVNDKDEVGYFQLGDYGYGIRFSTMHKPMKILGTGFSLDDWDETHETFTNKIVDRCFLHHPAWAERWAKFKEEKEAINHIVKHKASEFIANKKNLLEL